MRSRLHLRQPTRQHVSSRQPGRSCQEPKPRSQRPAKELGVEHRNVWYWVRKWKGDGTAEQFVAAKKAMDEGKPKEKAKGATAAAKLTFGDAGHTKAYSAAYKAAGHLVRDGTSQAQAARTVSVEYSVEFHVKTAARAAVSPTTIPCAAHLLLRCPLVVPVLIGW